MIPVNERLRTLRINNSMSMKDIADRFNMPVSTYSGYEAPEGKRIHRKVPIEFLVRLANFYKVSVDYLVGNDYDKTFIIDRIQANKQLDPRIKDIAIDSINTSLLAI